MRARLRLQLRRRPHKVACPHKVAPSLPAASQGCAIAASQGCAANSGFLYGILHRCFGIPAPSQGCAMASRRPHNVAPSPFRGLTRLSYCPRRALHKVVLCEAECSAEYSEYPGRCVCRVLCFGVSMNIISSEDQGKERDRDACTVYRHTKDRENRPHRFY